MRYLYDNMRHLVCLPYSVVNLHAMAQDLGIGRHWFDPHPYPHYDIPKRMMASIGSRAEQVRPREVLAIVKSVGSSIREAYTYSLRKFIREEIDRLVRNTAGMVGGADVGKSSGNRPPTMSALGGGKPPAPPDDIMGRAEEFYNDINVRLDGLVEQGRVSHRRIARMRSIIDKTMSPLINGDALETPNQLQATIASLTDAVDTLEAAV